MHTTERTNTTTELALDTAGGPGETAIIGEVTILLM